MKNFLYVLVLIFIYTGCTGVFGQDKHKTIKKEKTKLEKTKDTLITAEFKTNMGKFDVELFPDKAPKAVENFTTHAEKGFYKDIIFHRVIPNFMIQGGDPTGTGRGGESIWGKPFEDEFNSDLKFDSAGILAMANSGPNTNGSQFFITVAPTPWLNGHHTIFGKVTSGMNVVNSISEVQRNAQDKPLKNVVIESITIKKEVKK